MNSVPTDTKIKILNFGLDNTEIMRTLNIAISDIEYNKFGIKDEQLSFSELLDVISRELGRQSLNRGVALSERYGLSGMIMEEISSEVKAVRNNAAHS